MCLNTHHELTTVNKYSVRKQDDTGKHKLNDTIDGVATGMYYDRISLIAICNASIAQ